MTAPSSTQEAARLLRESGDSAVLVRGNGTKQDWAMPPKRVDLTLETGGMTGIVEHVTGDLVVVVRAGTPLVQVQHELAGKGQCIALDEMVPGATVGGAVAMNTSGPRRLAYGTVRDLLIGVTVVRPDGVVARAGGKVVKNVAGYDLGKLFTGSYGTLGLITECAFRLHPIPRAAVTLRTAVPDARAAFALAAQLRASQLVPAAIEIDGPPFEVAVLLEGTEAGVAQRARAIQADEGEPDWWAKYPWGTGDTGIKLTAALSKQGAVVERALAARERENVALRVRGSAGVGVLYAGVPGDTRPEVVARVVEDLREAAHDAGGSAVVLTAPPEVRRWVDMWGPVPGIELMRRVKQQFDPTARFAPGRFAGGI